MDLTWICITSFHISPHVWTSQGSVPFHLAYHCIYEFNREKYHFTWPFTNKNNTNNNEILIKREPLVCTRAQHTEKKKKGKKEIKGQDSTTGTSSSMDSTPADTTYIPPSPLHTQIHEAVPFYLAFYHICGFHRGSVPFELALCYIHGFNDGSERIGSNASCTLILHKYSYSKTTVN